MAGDLKSERKRLAERYATFATREAQGSCEIYERLALQVAETPGLLDFLLTLPPARRQPNLFLAAFRHLHGVPEDAERMLRMMRQDPAPVRAVMLSRTTQTNEAARCAALLPLLAQLRQPLALLEVGASAGLCLLPDRYGYDYGAGTIKAPEGVRDIAPVFHCRVTGDAVLPRSLPHVVWRRGLDLNPIDLTTPADVEWLETLVWPGQDERLRRLRAAIAVARHDPPHIVKGDLLTDLEPLIAQAPKGATVVVFHTAVLTYVSRLEDRERFAEVMRKAEAVWISNEAPGVFPFHAGGAPSPPKEGLYLLMRDGVPVAWTSPHGQSLSWFGALQQEGNKRRTS